MCETWWQNMRSQQIPMMPLLFTQPSCGGHPIPYTPDTFTQLTPPLRSYVLPEPSRLVFHRDQQTAVHDQNYREIIVPDTELELMDWSQGQKWPVVDAHGVEVHAPTSANYWATLQKHCQEHQRPPDTYFAWTDCPPPQERNPMATTCETEENWWTRWGYWIVIGFVILGGLILMAAYWYKFIRPHHHRHPHKPYLVRA